MKPTLILLPLVAALLSSGCAMYVNSPAVARSLKEKREAFSDPLIARATNAKPAMRFPATIAIAADDHDVREHLRALSAHGTLDSLSSLPQLARTVIISPVLVGETDREHRITADLRLREAAAKLHTDAVLILAIETQATDGRIIAPLTLRFGPIQLLALPVQQPATNARITGRTNHTWRQNDERQI